jgi:wyosine [tRNA(Phe)-imidazoG37] synthetase (radical SAM superfamily)
MSLGINMIPPGHCTYSCVYCQIGRTRHMSSTQGLWYDTRDVVEAVAAKLEKAKESGISVDWLSFVPEGEPTLERRLGEQIDGVKSLGVRIAVITNASLLWKNEVRKAIENADLVSVKIDTVSGQIWKRIARPHGELRLDSVLDGIGRFSCDYDGILLTETMLVAGINDAVEAIKSTTEFIKAVKPQKSFIAVPIRPPAETWVKHASEYKVGLAYHLLRERGIDTELLVGYEGDQFQSTGDIVNDLLSITAVHPMREDSIKEYLRDAGTGWDVIERLLKEKKLVEVFYEKKKFYFRSLRKDPMVENDTN